MQKIARNKDQFQQLKAHGLLGEEIVTGEGVALELPAATAASRLISGMIDYCLYALALFGSIWLIAYASPMLSEAAIIASATGSTAFWIILVPMLITGCTKGSSLGKLLTHTRVVRSDGGVISMRQAAIRAIAGSFEVWLTEGIVAFFTTVFSRRSQRIGDMLADTYVVRWPRSDLNTFMFTMPPSLEEWAQQVRTRELPGGLMLNIVQHFRAAEKLLPATRREEARVLAAAAEQYVTPPVQWGTDPEDFLSALMVVRNKVEYDRYHRTAQRHQQVLTAMSRLPY